MGLSCLVSTASILGHLLCLVPVRLFLEVALAYPPLLWDDWKLPRADRTDSEELFPAATHQAPFSLGAFQELNKILNCEI